MAFIVISKEWEGEGLAKAGGLQVMMGCLRGALLFLQALGGAEYPT